MIRFLLACLTILLTSLLFSSAAYAQQGAPFPAIEPAKWQTTLFSGAVASFDTPDEACRAQWQSYNPGAVYQSPTMSDWDRAACHWLGKQDGVESANTILPVDVYLRCPPFHPMVPPGTCLAENEQRAGSQCPSEVSATDAPLVGNPIDLQTGAKREFATDYASADGLLRVERHYNSLSRGVPLLSPTEVAGFGRSWHGLIPGHLTFGGSGITAAEYLPESGGLSAFSAVDPGNALSFDFTVARPSRARLTFVGLPGQTRAAFFAAPETTTNAGEFRLDQPNGDFILYRRAGSGLDSGGRRLAVPVEHHLASGYTRFFDYNAGDTVPYRVRDSFGRQLTLTWQAVTWSASCPAPCAAASSSSPKVLASIGLPDGTSLVYTYDYARRSLTTGGANDRLVSMRHLSATATVLVGRDYLYENNSYPYALTGIKDKDGNRLATFGYDAAGYASSTEHAGGVDRYLVDNRRIDESNLIRIETNPLGLQTTYRFNRNWWTDTAGLRPRNLYSVEIAATPTIAAQTWTIGFDNDRVNQRIDGRGIAANYLNDTLGRPTQIDAAVGRPEVQNTSLTWHATYDLPLTETRGDLRLEYVYDAQMRLTQLRQVDISTQTVPYSTNGQIRTWTYGWATNGRLLTINGPRPVNAQGKDDVLTFAYDTAGNLTTVTNGLNQVTTYSNYDANGRPGRVTDANGAATDFAYDSLGRLTTLTVRDMGTGTAHAVTSFEYDIEGRVVGVTRPSTVRLGMVYDLAGRLQSVSAPSGESIALTYDNMGNVTRRRVLNAAGTTRSDITRTFDELGRLLTETYGIGRTIGFAYDAQGNVTRSTSPRNFNTDAAFDGLARLTALTRPVGNGLSPTSTTSTATSTYNQNDDQVGFTDANAVATQFVYNGFGDLIREVSPDRGTTTYEYDSGGDLMAATDGRGQRVNYTRDILGRTLTMVPVALTAQTITYVYDSASIAGSYPVGRLSSITDASGTTKFKYDHRGNVLQVQQVISASASINHSYTYDLADRILTMTYPSGRIVTYTRDTRGRVATVTTRQTATAAVVTLVSATTYEPFGPLATATLGNGQTLNQVWQDGRLSAKRYTRANGTQFWANSYVYDGDDNLITLTDEVTAANSRSFTYDAVSRLIRVDLPTGTTRREDYVLDANDNRILVERRALPTTPAPTSTDSYTTVAGTNRLGSLITPAGTRTLSHDARGNLTGEVRPGSVTVTAGYDGFARLTSYTRTGASSLLMAYNGLDQRVRMTVGTVAHRFVQDDSGRTLGEYGANGTKPFAEYIWLLPEVGDAGAFGGDDGIGGWLPLAVVTANGAGGTQTLHWLASTHLGVPVASSNSTGTATTLTGVTLLGFPGQTQTFADLYYNQYRDYDPTTGRYIQADPIGLAGDPNPNVYAGANSVRFFDPTGEFVPILVGFAVGAGVDYLYQRYVEGRSNACVNWWSVGISGILGAAGGGIGRLGLRYADRSLEFSHWVPARYFRAMSLSGKSANPAYRPLLDNRLGLAFRDSIFNGNRVTPAFHSVTDPYRYARGFTSADNLHPVVQQVLRVPYVYAFPASSAGIGANIAGQNQE